MGDAKIQVMVRNLGLIGTGKAPREVGGRGDQVLGGRLGTLCTEVSRREEAPYCRVRPSL